MDELRIVNQALKDQMSATFYRLALNGYAYGLRFRCEVA